MEEDIVKLEEPVVEPVSEVVASISDESAPEVVEVQGEVPVYSSQGLLSFEFGNHKFEIEPEADSEGFHNAKRNDGIECKLQLVSGELKKIKYS